MTLRRTPKFILAKARRSSYDSSSDQAPKEIPTRKLSSSLQTISARVYPSKMENNTNDGNSDTIGFLSLFSEKNLHKLETKIKEKAKERNIAAETPELVAQINFLSSVYPEFPFSMLIFLVSRAEGNCVKVYNYLLDRGWSPQIKICSQIRYCSDLHYSTAYYYGHIPESNFLQKLFRKEIPGSFITFYRYDNNSVHSRSFKYYLCYKNLSGNLVEKQTKLPKVPELITAMLQLTNPLYFPDIRTTRQFIPCLDLI